MLYGYVENGVVKEGPVRLPSSWRNISGLDKMSPGALLAVGWLPWQRNYTAGDVDVDSTVTIGSSGIVETIERRPFSPQEIAEQAASERTAAEERRREAYILEADPLFFKWQRGETTQEAWLDKIAEIKERFPK